MKLIQLNVWMGKILQPALQLIEDEQPDVVCLQEVMDTPEKILIPDLMFNSLGLIKERGGFDYEFFSPTLEMPIANTRAKFGNAILSKFPLQNMQTFFVHGAFNDDLGRKPHIPNSRNVQTATVAAPNPFTIVNHHGFWEPTPMGSDVTTIVLHKVHSYIKELPRPLIMAGDFNVIPESNALRIFDSYLEDLTAAHHVDTTLSQLGKVSGVACDHIFVSPEVRVKTFQVNQRLVSDHLALVLEFDV